MAEGERTERISDVYRLADLELAEIQRQNGGPLTPGGELAVRAALAHAFELGRKSVESVVGAERDEVRARLEQVKRDYRALLKRISDSRSED